jgi:glutathione S-transferase
MTAKLYALPGSHPCAVVEAALRLKGIDYRRADLLPLTSPLVGRIAYRGATVPGLRIDGERLVGSRPILRRLDELVPDPALLPADSTLRVRVLEAEQWGDSVLQSVARRLVDAGFLRQPRAIESYAADARLLVPTALARPTLGLIAKAMARKNGVSDQSTRRDLADLPGWLDRVDRWMADGVLGGGPPNAADLQIGSSLRLLHSIGDLRPVMGGRPSMALIDLFPPEPGHIPAGLLPGEWVVTGSKPTADSSADAETASA